ncbi:aminoacyl-tRNA hydrolase [Candidatus Desantisbacteria bacterium CG1_02_38_46]|uniref:Peptidyl-tRNA hydrolase n=2 Tax=unclassified Candidatus Desantisiibacteriota TaxID=3106372 RepID=A0A2H9P9Q4_9BACT|nr:MAG: aminoacyl-tRNA hydrolase [Candidatus Desantisbacteria bacterium CG1_02_38_46]PIZ14982.1 MAG: aminoacyl-tRNA hydrolase [Candidatus Desantisbacteria bacterium CG_4_10_14_0_8_um_filter_39_17]
MILIVGLGNPGNKYKNTKHNLGFKIIDAISSRYKIKILPNKKFCAYLGRGYMEGEEVLLVKPGLFVNQSGTVVRSLVEYFNIPVQSGLIVICDDMNLSVGRMRIREKGVSGGHKGLESIIKKLGETNFIRIRIGIGRPTQKEDVTEYVLSGFEKSEKEFIISSISKAVLAIAAIINEGIKKAMNIYNREAQNAAES